MPAAYKSGDDRPFDTTLRELVRADAAAWVRLLGWEDVTAAEVLDSNVSSVRAEVDAAIAVRTATSDRWVLHIEFQTSRDPGLSERLLHYNRLLRRAHEQPVVSTVVLLRPGAAARGLNGRYRELWPDGRLALTFRYQMLRAWTVPTETWLHGPLALSPLAPLSELFGGSRQPAERQARARDVVERLHTRFRREADRETQRLLMAETYFVLGLRYTPNVAGRLLGGVGTMRDSLTYQAVLEEGRVEGRLEGRAEARTQEARQFVLRLGTHRFGSPSPSIQAKLDTLTDTELLERIGVAILSAPSWDAAVSAGA
ncbi:MAG: hypothetical protein U0821_27910 [Chloroflexota bacterium]